MSAEEEPAPDRPIVVALRSRRARRVQAVQKFQHAIPAAALLTQGIKSLSEATAGRTARGS